MLGHPQKGRRRGDGLCGRWLAKHHGPLGWAQDVDELRSIIEQWFSGKRHLLEHDRAVLKRALKAYRKSLKVTVLAAESSLAGGPMSSGRKSEIVGIRPPDRYPRAVWNELARQGRLLDAKQGLYELPPE